MSGLNKTAITSPNYDNQIAGIKSLRYFAIENKFVENLVSNSRTRIFPNIRYVF